MTRNDWTPTTKQKVFQWLHKDNGYLCNNFNDDSCPSNDGGMSECGKSMDSPPNLSVGSPQTSSPKEASTLQLLVFFAVVAGILYLCCTGFSRDTHVTNNVKNVLQTSSGEEESGVVMEKLLIEFMKEVKHEVRTMVPAEKVTEVATESSTFWEVIWFVIKCLVLFFVFMGTLGFILEESEKKRKGTH